MKYNCGIKTFKSNDKYFKFINRKDVKILQVVCMPDGIIKVRWCKKDKDNDKREVLL